MFQNSVDLGSHFFSLISSSHKSDVFDFFFKGSSVLLWFSLSHSLAYLLAENSWILSGPLSLILKRSFTWSRVSLLVLLEFNKMFMTEKPRSASALPTGSTRIVLINFIVFWLHAIDSICRNWAQKAKTAVWSLWTLQNREDEIRGHYINTLASVFRY